MTNSSSSTKIHRQCLETLVTSAAKVVVPGMDDLMMVSFDYALSIPESRIAKANIFCNLHSW